MKKKLKGTCRFLLPAILLAGAMMFAGCTQVEGDHYENAIRQEQKYQEQISGAKSNDREVEQDLDDIMDEVGELPSETVAPEASETMEEKTIAENQEMKLQFRKKKYLDEHYEKHGIEMGFADADAYLAAANAVVVNPNALHKKEKEDNDDIYYVEETNEFVVVSEDGYIRTYFNPSGGIDYYNRQ